MPVLLTRTAYNDYMSFVRFTLNFLLAMSLWTILGQFSVKGEKLELRYHAWVNGPHMQNVFATALAPFRWSKHKVASLWEDLAPSDSPTQAR